MSAPASTAPMKTTTRSAAHHGHLVRRRNSGATAASETSTSARRGRRMLHGIHTRNPPMTQNNNSCGFRTELPKLMGNRVEVVLYACEPLTVQWTGNITVCPETANERSFSLTPFLSRSRGGSHFRAVPTAPVTPARRSQAPRGGVWVLSRGP